MSSKGGGDKTDKKGEKVRFSEGEKVLCYHGPLIYEAKCLQTNTKEEKVEYFVHYTGWNKNWDEWVREDRLLKYNAENLEKQKELLRDHQAQKKATKRRTSVGSGGEKEESNSRSSSPKTISSRKSVSSIIGKQSNVVSTSTPTPITVSTPKNVTSAVKVEKQDFNSLRKRRDYVQSPEVEFNEHITVSVCIPEELRLLLVYDIELICRRKKVLKLPARITIDEITEKYVTHKITLVEEQPASRYKETAYALKSYFNNVLYKKLLYQFEKPQYDKYFESKPSTTPSSVYGIVHLIRLLVKIGHLLAHLQLDDMETNTIEDNINDYIKYITEDIGKFVNIEDYQSTNSDYQRKFKDIKSRS